MKWSDLKLRLRALFHPRRAEEDLADELAFHLAMQARKLRDAGVDPADAHRRASRDFGSVTHVSEQCRDHRGLHFLETVASDIRYALRGFRRAPGFALTVVGTIALGLGLNTALFTAFNAYVLRPLAVRDPSSLYEFSWDLPSGHTHRSTWNELRDFEQTSNAFADSFGQDFVFTRVDGHQMFGQLVSGNYFAMLGGETFLGRPLAPADAPAPGGQPVAVLSFSAWKNKFGADPNVVGHKLVVRGLPLEVVGVAREGFTGVAEIPPDFWAPLTLTPLTRDHNIRVVGRLRPGWSPARTKSALLAWARQYTANRPPADRAARADLVSRSTTVPLLPEVVAAMSPVLAAFALVLIVACANIANLMLARAMARQREIGVRLAIGAARPRLVRQLLTECILLALPAAAAGFLISQATIQGCVRLLFATMPRSYLEFISLIPLQPDLRVFVFMLGAAIAAALLFGLMPALQATRPDIMMAARGEFTTDHRPARIRHALVTAQVTVSSLILICAAMLLRTNLRISGVSPGLDVRGVIELDVQESLRTGVLQHLAAEPLVDIIAVARKTPFIGFLPYIRVTPEGSTENIPAGYQVASPEYFTIFHLPILRGRAFTADEARIAAPVAILSETTAQRLFPGRDPIGQRFTIARFRNNGIDPVIAAMSDARVIGVARDAVNGWIGSGTDSTCIFFPAPPALANSVILAHVRGDAEAGRQHLDAVLAAEVPGAVDQIHSVQEVLDAQRYPFRIAYWVSGALGALALALTLAGIYGVLSYLVAQRTREIGIRVALGAGTGQVIGLVMKQSMRFAVIGTAIGAVGAYAFGRFLASQIPDVDAFDLRAFALGSLLVFAASGFAACFPSMRAARIEPVTTLRQ